MNILIISSSNPSKWAGVLAKTYRDSFTDRGHKAIIITRAYDNYNDDRIINYYSKFEHVLLFKFPLILKKIRN